MKYMEGPSPKNERSRLYLFIEGYPNTQVTSNNGSKIIVKVKDSTDISDPSFNAFKELTKAEVMARLETNDYKWQIPY